METATTQTTKKTLMKTTKKIEAPVTFDDLWESMKTQGLPVDVATFHRTVTSGSGIPEYAFYSTGTHIESRLAKMWYAPCGLLCEQAKGKRVIVPHANIVYAKIV